MDYHKDAYMRESTLDDTLRVSIDAESAAGIKPAEYWQYLLYGLFKGTTVAYIAIFIYLYLQRNIYVYTLLTNQKINGQFPSFHVHP